MILETFQLNGRLLAAGDQLVQDLGLSSARWQVMGALVDGPLPAAQIARKRGLARQSVQRIVDILADDQVVEFAENPYHQRAKLVGLTTRGRKLYDEVMQRQMQWANLLAQGLSAKELNAAVHLLETVRLRLEKPIENEKDNGKRSAINASEVSENPSPGRVQAFSGKYGIRFLKRVWIF